MTIDFKKIMEKQKTCLHKNVLKNIYGQYYCKDCIKRFISCPKCWGNGYLTNKDVSITKCPECKGKGYKT